MNELQEAIRELFGDLPRIGAGPNTRDMLEDAERDGIVKRTGRMRMIETEGVIKNTPLGPLPLIGALYDEYEICPE